MAILAIISQESAQRLHISAHRIIISSLPIFMHMSAHIRHISAHIVHILAHIDEPRIIMRIVISHISAQSIIMQRISAVMPSILPHIIFVSMHIDMHMLQSSIHRHMEAISIFIISIAFLQKGWISAR